jgi:DNA-3-methyladenine glycosylase
MDWGRAFEHPRPRSWYNRPTAVVARDLLGDWLVGPTADGWRVARIVETEAYVAGDPASHAYRGPTARTRSMFAGPGTWYVFRIHQVHCANLTTRSGEAVLLRSAQPVTDNLGNTRGPGRLCRAFGMSRKEDGTSAVDGEVLRVLPGNPTEETVVVGRRVGIRLATLRRLRFALRGNPWVSFPRPPGWRV